MSFECPYCPETFDSKISLGLHLSFVHSLSRKERRQVYIDKGYVKSIKSTQRKYDEKTLEELERISDKNLLRFHNGGINKLSSPNKKILMERGFISRGKRKKYKFTEKGQKMLEELKRV